MSTLVVGTGHTACALALTLQATRVDGLVEGFAIVGSEAKDIDAKSVEHIVYAVDKGVDEAEQKPVPALIALGLRPAEIWAEWQTRGVKRFTYISSDCVWKGPYNINGAPFNRDYQPSPNSVYGHARVIGERMLERATQGRNKLCILRPRLLHSTFQHEDNFAVKMLRFTSLSKAPQSITSISTLAKAVQTIDDGLFCVYDRGVLSATEIGIELQRQGIRGAFGDYTPASYDLRVDVVMHDSAFERMVDPPPALDAIVANCKAVV